MAYVDASLATSETTSIPQNTDASTTILFQSHGNLFGGTTQEANPYAPSSATAAVGSSGTGTGAVGSGKDNSHLLLYFFLAIGAYAVYKHFN